MKNGKFSTGSLCWSCAKSCPKLGEKSCSWVEDSEPVAGWVAERHVRPQNGVRNKVSYFVKECPGFTPEMKEDRRISKNGPYENTLLFAESLFDSFSSEYTGYLNAYKNNPNRDTRYELKTYESRLKYSSLKELLPAELSIEAYIIHMRELYLPKDLLKTLSI